MFADISVTKVVFASILLAWAVFWLGFMIGFLWSRKDFTGPVASGRPVPQGHDAQGRPGD